MDSDGYEYTVSYRILPGRNYPPVVDTLNASPGKALVKFGYTGELSYANATSGHNAPAARIRNAYVGALYTMDRPVCAHGGLDDYGVNGLADVYCVVGIGEMVPTTGPDPSLPLSPGQSGRYPLDYERTYDALPEAEARELAADIERGPDHVGLSLPMRLGEGHCGLQAQTLVQVGSIVSPLCD